MTPEEFIEYIEEVFSLIPLTRKPNSAELLKSEFVENDIKRYKNALDKVKLETVEKLKGLKALKERWYKKLVNNIDPKHFSRTEGVSEIHRFAKMKLAAKADLLEAKIEYRMVRDVLQHKIITPDQNIPVTPVEIDNNLRRLIGEKYFEEVTKFYREVVDRLYPKAVEILEGKLEKCRKKIEDIIGQPFNEEDLELYIHHSRLFEPFLYKGQITKYSFASLDLANDTNKYNKLTALNGKLLSYFAYSYQCHFKYKEDYPDHPGRLVKRFLREEFEKELKTCEWLKVRDRFVELYSTLQKPNVTVSVFQGNTGINKRYLYILYRDREVINMNRQERYPVYRTKRKSVYDNKGWQ